MISMDLAAVVRRIVNTISDGDFENVIAQCSTSRLSADDLQSVFKDYGRSFIRPPENAYENLDAVAIQNATTATWSVRAPLWSQEEGRSDLTVELTICDTGEQ